MKNESNGLVPYICPIHKHTELDETGGVNEIKVLPKEVTHRNRLKLLDCILGCQLADLVDFGEAHKMSSASSSHAQYSADESGYVMETPSIRVDTESEPEEDPKEVSSRHTRSTKRTPVAREPTPPPPLPA
ncbi:hypothetical protein E3N88_09307 [Mikania micrantha]|uniref:Uncharacterized protein n=1 Tax=Mikania micrantha TaxID=192012 RepID=A0A5N6PKM6_9ASTR|nr:hypothetical protein E3N88_09307 [Mikania micrantha]